jgi:hypothetical protein
VNKPKPIRPNRVIGRQIWRVPESGYVTPRLRESSAKDCIGFVHSFDRDDDSDTVAKRS